MKRCPLCGGLSDSGALCPGCVERLCGRTGGFCPRCGTLFGSGHEPPALCPECIHNPPPWDRLLFHGIYDDALRRSIISFKYKNSLGRTRILTELAVTAFRRGAERTPDCVIPVPLHTRRLVWRGFNQSLEIANALGRSLKVPVEKTALKRVRHTPPQTRLGMRQRRENIKGAFQANRDRITGRTVLLVDDVYTTGATIRECARILRRAGAAGVDVLVLARAQED